MAAVIDKEMPIWSLVRHKHPTYAGMRAVVLPRQKHRRFARVIVIQEPDNRMAGYHAGMILDWQRSYWWEVVSA